jgi:hypothetical protein
MESKYNYLVVHFKNKEKKKIIKKFVTKEKALDFYNKKIKENPIFSKLVENNEFASFELGLLESTNIKVHNTYFAKDDLGRQNRIILDSPDFNIIKINDYLIEELIYDQQKRKKISIESLIKTYLPKNTIKLISKLNNKFVVQNDNEFNIFTLKNEFDCERFLDVLQDYMISKNRIDCIIVKDSSSEQKKYLYDLLSENGFSKSSLYRKSTTFNKDG